MQHHITWLCKNIDITNINKQLHFVENGFSNEYKLLITYQKYKYRMEFKKNNEV